MAFAKTVESSVADLDTYIEGVAKNIADRLWGANGPVWGTKLTELEDIAVAVRESLSKKMLEQAAKRQAATSDGRPEELRDCPQCGGATRTGEPEPRIVTTRGGEIEWQEPKEHCPRCRRAFFPSIQRTGD
jgi:predicted RNA-binding Zn ribbon-like protein